LSDSVIKEQYSPQRDMKVQPEKKNNLLWSRIKRGRYMYLLILPGLIYFLLFKYFSMWGILLAFKDYSFVLGFWESQWVGLTHFRDFLASDDFWVLFRNTLVLSILNLVLFFPAPIVFSLILNEVREKISKRFFQTVVYIPHFFSWVVVVGISVIFLSTQDGIVNKMIVESGHDSIGFLTTPEYFRANYVLQNIWKETGYNSIIFLAALTTIDPSLYEAAVMDGASRWKRMLHITLPALKSTIIILFILRLGHVLDTGFEHIFLMLNPMVLEVGDVFDTYVYREGILMGHLSYTTAVGLFKSIIAFILVVSFNYLAKKTGEEGVF
jgi:putative aldouronate transport system permease protein